MEGNLWIMTTIDTLYKIRMAIEGEQQRIQPVRLDYESDRNMVNTLSESSNEKFRLIQLW